MERLDESLRLYTLSLKTHLQKRGGDPIIRNEGLVNPDLHSCHNLNQWNEIFNTDIFYFLVNWKIR